MQERKACNPEFKEHCKQTKKRSLQKRLGVTQILGIIRLPLKTELVPIYNKYNNLDKDEFNEEG